MGGDAMAGVDGEQAGEGRVLDDGDHRALQATQQGLVVGVKRGQGIELARETGPADQLQGVLDVGEEAPPETERQHAERGRRIVVPQVLRDHDVGGSQRVLEVAADLIGAAMAAVAHRLGDLMADQDRLHEARLASRILLKIPPARARSGRASSET
jgi:hypothetical protein